MHAHSSAMEGASSHETALRHVLSPTGSLGRMSSFLLQLPPDFLEEIILHPSRTEWLNVEQLEKKQYKI